MTQRRRDTFWRRGVGDGEFVLRLHSKVLLTLAPVLAAPLLFQLLVIIEGFAEGHRIVAVLAYMVIVLVVAMLLLVVIVSLIDYLRSLE